MSEEMNPPGTTPDDHCADAQERSPPERTIPTTCIETIDGDPDTALRLSFQIKVF